MKLMKYIFIIYLFLIINVNASTGAIKQNTVIKCDGIYYGAHATPKHWHIVKKDNDKWVIKDNVIVEEPKCYGDIENIKEEVKLSKCIDGDTAKFIFSDGDIKTTRFLAIDTPESVHPTKEVEKLGKEASDYTCNLLTNAKTIILEYDKNSDKEDKYGRILAFVYADSLMVQKELIKIGYAKVAYLYADYTYTDILKELEKDAQSKELGIWESLVASKMDTNEEESSDNTEKKQNKGFINLIISILDEIFDFVKKIVSKIFAYL